MHFHKILLSISLACFSLLVLPVAAAETEENLEQQNNSPSIDCEDPVNAARHEIKDTVGPLYANGADQPALQIAANRIDKFITNATYCRMALQSGSEKVKPETIGEWISLQQWLNRLADTFARSASDSEYTNWKDEYTLFAEVYEFEP